MSTQNAIGGGNFVFPQLTGVSYPRAFGSNLPTGDNDIYTVPTGKKALVSVQQRGFNGSAGTIVYNVSIKVGGVYYRIGANTTLTTGTGGAGANILSPIVLNAGESLSVNTTTTAGLNVLFNVMEFDATNSLSSARILALSSGDNTLYTVTSGKSLAMFTSLYSAATALVVANATGGAVNIITYAVPSGGSSGSTNKVFPSTSVGDKSASQFSLTTNMSAGDFVVVNSDSATAGQVAYMTYFEV